jgi:hypothetical protein
MGGARIWGSAHFFAALRAEVHGSKLHQVGISTKKQDSFPA